MPMRWLITPAHYFSIKEKHLALQRLLVLEEHDQDKLATTPWEAPHSTKVAVQEPEPSGPLLMVPTELHAALMAELESQGFVCLLASHLQADASKNLTSEACSPLRI